MILLISPNIILVDSSYFLKFHFIVWLYIGASVSIMNMEPSNYFIFVNLILNNFFTDQNLVHQISFSFHIRRYYFAKTDVIVTLFSVVYFVSFSSNYLLWILFYLYYNPFFRFFLHQFFSILLYFLRIFSFTMNFTISCSVAMLISFSFRSIRSSI